MTVTCKNCGRSSIYTGSLCPECGVKLDLTPSEVTELLNGIRASVKNRQYRDAAELYKALADDGYTDAEKEYAKLLESGQLVERNLDLAMEYFYRAARKNEPYSAYRYSRLLSRENDEAARFWLFFSAILGAEEAFTPVAEEFCLRGYTEETLYFYSLAAACDDVDAIVTLAKIYNDGSYGDPRPDYAKWYMDKLKIPPIYAIKLAYKLRHTEASEPPKLTLKNYDGLLHRLRVQARNSGFESAYVKLSEILASRGDVESDAAVGISLVNGDGCERNVSDGLMRLISAAGKGSVTANLALADMYAGDPTIENYMSKAITHYERAGELGSMEGYETAADILYKGDGIDSDRLKALELYDSADKLGSASARKKAEMIRSERERLYRAALEVEDTDPRRAARALSAAILAGHPDAALKLADCYAIGKGVKQNNRHAFLLYENAVELGSIEALLPYGLCLANGMGTRLDYAKAREALSRAEKHGIEGAHAAIRKIMQNKIKKVASKMYSTAMRLIYLKKYKTAKKYLEVASDLLHAKATYALGCMNEFGMGCESSRDTAATLYEKAASLKFYDPHSSYKLAMLRSLKSKSPK